MQWMVGLHDAPSTPHSTQHPAAGRHHIYHLHPHLLGCLKLAAKCLVAFSVHQQASLTAVDCSLAVRAGDILHKSMQQWQSGAAADQQDSGQRVITAIPEIRSRRRQPPDLQASTKVAR